VLERFAGGGGELLMWLIFTKSLKTKQPHIESSRHMTNKLQIT
jgi:hypothetical protein